MKVKDVMTGDVIAVTPETPIHEAAQLMVQHGVSGLPVADAAGRLLGIVSEGDLILRQKPRPRLAWWRVLLDDGERLARDYRKAAGTTVGEVMTRAVISVGPELPLESAALILDTHHVKRLPVLLDGAVVGIVSRGDLVKALAAAPPPALSRTDAQLLAEMRARIAAEPWAAGQGLVLHATDGVLSLWGVVGSEEEKKALETMARAIEGCRGVDNHVMVRSDLPYTYA